MSEPKRVRTDLLRASKRRIGQRVVVLIGDRRYPGTVAGIDVEGQPPGVQVEFDKPVNGSMTCYATHNEVSHR